MADFKVGDLLIRRFSKDLHWGKYCIVLEVSQFGEGGGSDKINFYKIGFIREKNWELKGPGYYTIYSIEKKYRKAQVGDGHREED